ncbi:hypothetical protein RhiirC2_843597 [Rhizophagus irregularis]|uniref:Hsp70 family protein n=1 Tax=Rhizophagus irregularis TaxID=588596 RepID=A0A2N1NWT6_9GLOM|nr:hypothetical protein RhiirC2_843597 [Rhizophagus irregularis]
MDDSSENLFSDKPREFIEKLGFCYYELNNKFINLLEENQKIKQQCKNLEEKNQENLRLNSELNKKNQEISCTNSNLIKENKEVSRINSELKEKLEEKEKKIEEFQRYVSNLENQRNEELKQLKKLEMMSQNLDKNLGILKLEEINENIIKTFRENNEDFLASFSNKDPNESLPYSNIKVVVGLDFGTTYSGFSYCHVANKQNICSNEIWPGKVGKLKINTILRYDDEYNNVLLWGAPALVKKQIRKIAKKNNQYNERNKLVELFKLFLGNLQENSRPKLPVDYKKAITDYLKEFGKVIKDTIATHWNINFFENVLLILTVPAEYSEKYIAIMRECAYNANLINDKYSKNLQFISAPEAAAIYCMKNELQKYDLLNIEETFMVVDCGGGTVDLTTRKLVGNKLSEITERIGYFCGSTFIDREFIEFLRRILGYRAIDHLKENNYDQFQCLVQEFRKNAKEPFTGVNREFYYELDIENISPNLLQYVDEEIREMMEKDEWLIKVNFNDIKLMFDPIIDRIIRLIYVQLENIQKACSAMFLVGGFSENKYLQRRIKQEFCHYIKCLRISDQPIAAISRGAVVYGLSIKSSDCIISSRVLKYTYGIKLCVDWKEGDPIERKTFYGKVFKFSPLVRKGTVVKVDQVFNSSNHRPSNPSQTALNFALYRTSEYNVEYCDEPGVELLGSLRIDLPDVHLGYNRSVTFGLSFGQMEISAFAENAVNGQKYVTSFSLNDDDD